MLDDKGEIAQLWMILCPKQLLLPHWSDNELYAGNYKYVVYLLRVLFVELVQYRKPTFKKLWAQFPKKCNIESITLGFQKYVQWLIIRKALVPNYFAYKRSNIPENTLRFTEWSTFSCIHQVFRTFLL